MFFLIGERLRISIFSTKKFEMKKYQMKIKKYIQPSIEVVGMLQENSLLQASGQHKNAGSGGVSGDAKKNFFYEEEDEEAEEY